MMNLLAELALWTLSIEPAFAFLLLLPLLVAAAGIARELFDRCRGRSRG